MLSPLRGWLQQELDQKSGHRRFSAAALLQEELTRGVEDEERKGAVQHAVAVVALALAEVADFAVGLVDQDEGLLLAGDDPAWPGCQPMLTSMAW